VAVSAPSSNGVMLLPFLPEPVTLLSIYYEGFCFFLV
jgi:hypothetical protein